MNRKIRKFVSLFMAALMFAAVIPFSGLQIEASAAKQADKSQVVLVEADTAAAAEEDSADAAVNPLASIISMIKDLIEVIKAAVAFIKADLPGLPFSLKK